MEVVGREREIALIGAFLDAPQNLPAALLISGEAGIGKTTLWRHALDEARARALRVLACTGAQAEARFAYAALADLVRGTEEGFEALPGPQRTALEAAVFLSGSPQDSLDQRAVAFGFVSLLHALARNEPLILAMDDAGWVDPASAAVVAFGLRRLAEAPVGVLLTWRTDAEGPAPLDIERALARERLHHLSVGPVSLSALHRMLRLQLGTTYSRTELRRLHEVTEGNPFFALELSRALARRGEKIRIGEPLPVPGTLRDLFRERLDGLPRPTREALLATAISSQPTLRLLDEVLSGDAETHLGPAVEAGLIEVIDGIPRFVHPLVASAVHEEAEVRERRAVHARFAKLVIDPEEGARHLALSTPAPDLRVAEALEQAVDRAARRGAPAAAAELAELAARFADDPEARRRSLVAAAEHHFTAGQVDRTLEILEPILEQLPPGANRARALCQLSMLSAPTSVGLELLEQALEHTGDAPSLASYIHLWISFLWLLELDLERAAAHARASMKLGERAGDPVATLEGLSEVLLVDVCAGKEVSDERMQRALDAGERLAHVRIRGYGPALVAGLRLMYLDRHAEARKMFELAERRAFAHGDEEILDSAVIHTAQLELRAGAWDRAAALAGQVRELMQQLGLPERMAIGDHLEALVAAYRGRVEEARCRAQAALAALRVAGHTYWTVETVGLMGFLELSLGDAEAAVRTLRPLTDKLLDRGWGEPSFLHPVANLIEALIELGEADEAARLHSRLEERLGPRTTPLGVAQLARSRGLLAAAAGELDEALSAFDRGLTEGRVDPFERARLLLCRGVALRRARRRGAARRALEESRSAFETLGARLWSERARREIERLGGRSAGELTPTERRIAALVAEGRSNKEVAAALFVSVKTVEANLSRVYKKLGVRSRTQLTRRFAEQPQILALPP